MEAFAETRELLRTALHELVPGCRVYIFGSLTKPGVFNDRSDVDLALEAETPEVDSLHLTAELMERLNRRVDVVLLDRCRFRDKIRREGELWIA